MAKPTGNPAGRPSIYTEELAVKICRLLAAGRTLRSICREDWAPHRTTVDDWIILDREGFAGLYARARDRGLDVMAEDAVEIADTPVEAIIETSDPINGTKITKQDATHHRKLRVDTRKWYLSKLAPKRYGDRLEIEHKGGSLGERIRAGRKRAGQT